ncbi:type IV pilus biogenesis protein PilM [Trinickia acidisoli]|uniref:type IV pilus biogenesis protein PilM n=1 Tax=Trinickia acidisoli TaxID=2767482 RepID=UPI001A8C5964|nr:type IV pilus biogenesis protein PilM [Trinickia acidisoli]
MLVIAIFAVFAMLIAGYETFADEQMNVVSTTSTQALALNLAAYRQTVIAYVLANPSFQGAVQTNQLTPTANYTPNAMWQGYVQNGMVVVYTTSAVSPQLVVDMSELAQGSVLAGRALNGSEVPPTDPTIAVTLPSGIASAIPNGSPVWLAQVNPS